MKFPTHRLKNSHWFSLFESLSLKLRPRNSTALVTPKAVIQSNARNEVNTSRRKRQRSNNGPSDTDHAYSSSPLIEAQESDTQETVIAAQRPKRQRLNMETVKTEAVKNDQSITMMTEIKSDLAAMKQQHQESEKRQHAMLQTFTEMQSNFNTLGEMITNNNARQETADAIGMLREANEKLNNLETKYQCKICLEKAIDVCFVPCGHMVCSRCSVAGIVLVANTRTCPFCKTIIGRVTRLFFA